MMKLKQFMLALVAMLLGFAMPTSAQVAKVGNTEYATIDEAIANWTNGTTLTLLADVTLSDVIKLSSTEHHILDLGTYTMTAGVKKNSMLGYTYETKLDAIEIVCNGRSKASYALTVNADADNPGGITANGKSCIYYKKSGSTQDRPIILINNGVFNGSNSINSTSNGNTNCPQIWINGGVFNGNVNLTKNLLQITGGTFHGSINCTGDVNAYRLISGGRFKSWQFMTNDNKNGSYDKFGIATSKDNYLNGNYNVGVYIDAEGYLVVGGAVIKELSPKYKAVVSYDNFKTTNQYNNFYYYLAQSSAATYGLFYEDAEMAIAKHGAANVTVWEKPAVTIPEDVTGDATVVEEIKNNTALKDYTPENLPAGAELEIVLESVGETFVYDVTPMANGEEVEPTEAITFRLPVPASVTEAYAKVYHEGELMGIYEIKGEANAKYVEVSSAEFSEFAVEPTVVAAKIGETVYETIQATIKAAKEGDVVVICAGEYGAINISNKNITIQGTVGENGELLTTIKGGNPAITAHGFNGTIKDIKIVDAFKVMYAEPAGNVTVDNIYVTGATYGLHLVAYAKDLTWTIQNSYMDLSWANSCGVYGNGDAAIVITGNKFESTAPYYPDYGALAVNTFLPNVTIEENIFGENTKIYIDKSVTDLSNVYISKNYHADGVDNAFADDTDGVKVDINKYYAKVDVDGSLTELVTIVRGLDGEGTEASPYLINNVDELVWFRDNVDKQAQDGTTQYAGKYIKLTADIDLAGINWNPIGSMSGDHGSFKGVFDGDNHIISNLNVVQEGNGIGFFARTSGNAVVKNLKFNNVTVKSTNNSNYVGGVVGNAYASTKIENVHVTGNVLVSGRGYIGGIAGHGYVVMENVSVVANEGSLITSTFWCAGGILGYAGEGSTNIKNAHVEGLTITSAAGGLGAIVGMAEDNNGTQPISGSNLSAKNVEIKTYTGAYGDSYSNYALGYLYGGNPTSKLTGDLSVENVAITTSNGVTPEVNDAVATVDGTVYFDFEKAITNAEGKTVTLLKDVEVAKTFALNSKTFTLDGKGKTIRQAAGCTNTYALLDITGGNVTIKNVTFDGVKGGAVVRTVGTEFAMDNVTAQNCEHTQQQGLFRLVGKNTITNSTFKNNTCTMVMTLNFDGASDTPQLVDNCVFEGNTVKGTAALYYVKGEGFTLTNSEFTGNTVNCNNNGATIYLGFTENNVVTGNLFKDNKVDDTSASTRVAGAIFFGYEANISGNVFVNNTATNANSDVLGQVCTSTYYGGTIDLGSNYWGGEAPVYGKDYTIQHQTGEGTFALNSYYTTYTTNEQGNVVVADKKEVAYAAQVGKLGYATLAEAVAAVKEDETVTILAGTYLEGTIKLPATLQNVTFKGAEGAILKDMTISAADGNAYSYVGLTFDGITFDNSRLLFTGWRNGDEIIENLTVTNCTFKNLNDNTNTAPVHINKDASEAVKNFTFTNNVIDGATGGTKSGVYAQLTGDVVFTGNVINNVSFRPYVIQLTTDDGIADNFTVTGNTFSGSKVGRAQGLGNNAAGTDEVVLVVSNNIFKGITDAQQICYWNFNAETTTADLSGNYYGIDIVANPSRIYFNSAATGAADLVAMKVFPIYTALNEDGTIDMESAYNINGVATKAELQSAITNAKDGETIVMIADIDYGTDQLAIAKAITLDLGDKTLTTRNAYGGMSIKGNPTVKNGTIVHASNTAAIKVWNATAFEDLVIDVQGKGDANKTIGGIVLQSGSTTNVGTIKNVTIKGEALTNGIETYNCGDATENVIGAMENVTIDAQGTGMLISAPCGTATNCDIKGGTNGIEIWIKGNYSASLDLVNSKVEGGVYAHDEFSSNPDVVNNGTLKFTADEQTTGAKAEDVTLTLVRAENVEGVVKEVKDNAQAKVNDTYFATIAAAFATAKAGDVVTVFEGTYAMPAMKAGITIVGQGDVKFEGTLTGTLENLTMKNIHIKGGNAQRWAYAKGNLVFENVTFEATGIYALHFDGITAGANLTYKNCTIIGWAAMSGSPESCTFEGCTFKGNGTYGLIRTYFDATIKDCTFDVANVNTTDIYQDGIHAVSGAVVTVTNCTNANGDMKDIVNIGGASVVLLDGVKIQNVAKIGDTYFATIDAAMASTVEGVVDIFTDVTINDSDANGYTFTKEAKVNGKLTYKRTLASEAYNALYVPFEIPVEEFADKYEFFYFNDVHSDLTGKPSSFEIIKITKGTLKAHHPYIVKPLDSEYMEMSLVIENAVVRSTAAKQHVVDCSSAYTLFTVRGTYSVLNGADYPGCYGISVDGDFAQIGTGKLGAFRIYLQITDRETESPVILSSSQPIRLRLVGEGNSDTTDIKYYESEVQGDDFIYDLQGRRVLEPKKGVIYVINGKKVIF